MFRGFPLRESSVLSGSQESSLTFRNLLPWNAGSFRAARYRSRQLVILIPDGQHGRASQSRVGHGPIERGEIKLADFLVLMMDLRAFGPVRGIFGGLGFVARYRQIL